MENLKQCKACKEFKPNTEEFYYKDSGTTGKLATTCKEDVKARKNKHYKANRESILERLKEKTANEPLEIKAKKREQNRARVAKRTPEEVAANKKKHQERYQQDKEEILTEKREQHKNMTPEEREIYLQKRREEWANRTEEQKIAYRAYRKKKKQEDKHFHLRITVGNSINKALKRRGFKKNKASILDFLPYSIAELKEHLERLWQPWMNWNNYGVYDSKTWDDNDSGTWTWNLDHIIPDNSFNYTCMSDPEFLECWALSNLRPLSAKANNLKGPSLEAKFI